MMNLTQGPIMKDHQGRLYFGGVNGFNEINPNQIKKNTFTPPVILTDFLLLNKSVAVGHGSSDSFQLEQTINYTDEITLNYSDYIMSFEFSALNYRQSEKNNFKYMLEGLDNHWIETGYKHRRATFTNLAHGEYTLKIKASNDDGLWNEEGTSIKLTILPPPWKSWWAYCLYTLAFLLMIGGILHYLKHKAKQRELEGQIKFEEQLRRSQKMEALGVLTGGIAHEFNNLLYPILGNIELLIQTKADNDPDKESLKHVQDAGLRAKELVKQMLAYGRKSLTQRETIQIKDLVNDTVQLLSNTIPHNIKIETYLPLDIQPIVGMPSEIHQVIVNLCINAYQAMPDGGLLSIELNEKPQHQYTNLQGENIQDDFVELSIKDTGYGIEQDTMEKIFDPFFTTKKIGKGTGLGLSVVQGIMEQHDGHIIVNSNNEEGTSFKLYFPVAVNTEIKTTPELSEPIHMGKGRILIIDDEPMITFVGKKMLEKLGYSVIDFLDCQIALEYFWSHFEEIDLVLTDYDMPWKNGKEMAQKLIQIKPEIPIILVTGYGDLVAKEEIHNWGMKGLLIKPFKLHELSHLVRIVLNKDYDLIE